MGPARWCSSQSFLIPVFGSELCFKSEKTRGFRKKSVRNYLSGINLDKTIQHGGKQRPKIGKHHVQKEDAQHFIFDRTQGPYVRKQVTILRILTEQTGCVFFPSFLAMGNH